MSKRSNPSNDVLPAKRPRKPAGFRLARPRTTSSQPSTLPSPNTSLFITVSQLDDQRGTLRSQNRFLASTQSQSVNPTPEPSTFSSAPQSDIPLDNEIHEETVPPTEQPTIKPKRMRNTTNSVWFIKCYASNYLTIFQHRLTEWIKFRSAFLDEALRHDGLGDFLGQSKCSNCGNTAGVIKCRDCANGGLLKCPECSIASHRSLPLHRVEVSGHAF
jgi:hypothetical protein